ncbi:membrane protein [Vibrio variabilis]|uniref:Membrane protein n=1 Tax=Vibrio variabilis TaxID=990271 RepID=A0ABR4YB32_9VIBR|nr:hypothetical protein [Vibrio variabilis]KHA60673.1 membrane protein [Vibrio variabilis]
MDLRSTIKFAIIGNIVAFSVVFALESSTHFFGIKYPSDYAFFVLMLLWGSAALLYMYPPGTVAALNTKQEPSEEAVSSEEEKGSDNPTKRLDANSITCLKLLVSGAPALIYCVIAQLIN